MDDMQIKYNQRKQTVYYIIRNCAERIYRMAPVGYKWDPDKDGQVNQDLTQ